MKLLRVPDAVQRHSASKTRVKRAYGDAPLIRDRHGPGRSRVCSAPFVSLMLRCARDTQIHTVALFLLGVLRHAGTVRVDADGATHEPETGEKSAGAAGRIRTVNLSLTKRLLCR